jgi:hypothetical protein
VPTDRPIDGIDASSFLLGNSQTTGRDHVIYYGSDAAVMSVKWKTMKVVFRYSESTSGPIIKPQWPFVYDLIDDPNEEWDLIDKRLDCAWVILPVAKAIGALAQSAARYPHPPGGVHWMHRKTTTQARCRAAGSSIGSAAPLAGQVLNLPRIWSRRRRTP